MPLMSRIVLSFSKKHAETSLQNFRRFGSSKRFFSSTYSRSTQSKISPHPLTEQTMMGDLEGLKCTKKYGSVRRYRSSSRELRDSNKPPSLPEQAATPTSCRSLKKEQHFRAVYHSIETLKKEIDILDKEIDILQNEDHSIETLKKEIGRLLSKWRTLRKALDEIRDDVREMPQSITEIDVMDKKYENMTRLMGHVAFYGVCAALAYRAWF